MLFFYHNILVLSSIFCLNTKCSIFDFIVGRCGFLGQDTLAYKTKAGEFFLIVKKLFRYP